VLTFITFCFWGQHHAKDPPARFCFLDGYCLGVNVHCALLSSRGSSRFRLLQPESCFRPFAVHAANLPLIDTRESSGEIQGELTVPFTTGNNCSVPANARAFVMNATVSFRPAWLSDPAGK
jgi:hypothetical protein